MNKYDAIIIGFGKGGKTLAGFLGDKGFKVAIIEKSNKMYGGTCINIGCIPTKSLVHSSKIIKEKSFETFEEMEKAYRDAVNKKRELVSLLRNKNFAMLDNKDTVDVYTGTASFVSNNEVKVDTKDEEITLFGEKIFINTGAETVIPNIDGINETKNIYTSTSIMELDKLPKELVIVGGGYIGLEFASTYSAFGSKVTVLEGYSRLMPREDSDVAEEVKTVLEKKGIEFKLSSKVESFKNNGDKVLISYYDEENKKSNVIEGDAVLLATGRKPNTEGLNLEAAGVELTERGAVKVNSKLRTNVENIWAIGDVKGGLQFTYISLDDFRIIKDDLFGDGKRSLEDRANIPYSVFIDPVFSRVGLSEEEAIKAGYEIKVAKLQAAGIPRARVIDEIDGFMKAVVDAKTNKILGCTLFCAESSEIINIVDMAIKTGQDYTYLRDNIFTHPTMSEALNDLFNLIK